MLVVAVVVSVRSAAGAGAVARWPTSSFAWSSVRSLPLHQTSVGMRPFQCWHAALGGVPLFAMVVVVSNEMQLVAPVREMVLARAVAVRQRNAVAACRTVQTDALHWRLVDVRNVDCVAAADNVAAALAHVCDYCCA